MFARSTAAYNKQIGNITFAISIPDQTLIAGTNPTDGEITKSIALTNVSLATTGITNPYIIGNRAYYQFILVQTNTSADQATNWPADTDNPVISLTFPTDSYFSGMLMNDLTFNCGVRTFGMFWFVQSIEGFGDLTDYTSPF